MIDNKRVYDDEIMKIEVSTKTQINKYLRFLSSINSEMLIDSLHETISNDKLNILNS